MPTNARSSFHLQWECKNRSELLHCKQIARWTTAPRFCCPNYDEIFPSCSQVLKSIMQQVLYIATCPYKHTQYFIISICARARAPTHTHTHTHTYTHTHTHTWTQAHQHATSKLTQGVIFLICTGKRRLTTGIPSEKCAVRRLRRCANVIECTYTNLDNIAYYTPRLYGIAYCS